MTSQKQILITGGTGSWGQELTRQLLEDTHIGRIVIYSRGEHKQVEMKRHLPDPRLQFVIGDVRDLHRLHVAMKGIDRVYHLAALKHVPVCEENPWEAVQTNVLGTNNVIEAAIMSEVPRVVYVSTDKAVDPCNAYGLTKACAEKLIVNANLLSQRTRFVCIRAGNILGSTGSVVPLFIEQIGTSNTITLTDRSMTRFFMPIDEAISRVLTLEDEAVGGEIIVLRMQACRIADLAEVLKERFGRPDTKVIDIGRRPGEKLHELLISRHEADRVVERRNELIVVPGSRIPEVEKHYRDAIQLPHTEEFSSKNAAQLDKPGIRSLLAKLHVFER